MATDKQNGQAGIEDFLSFEDIIAADDLETRVVEMPEWPKNGKPGKITLRQLSAEDAIMFVESNKNPGAEKTSNIRLVMKCAVKPDGSPLFPDATMLQQLLKKNVKAFNKLATEALDLNGFDIKSREALKNASS